MENRMRKRMTVILNSKMNMRRFYVSAALLLTTLLAVAENNPYRSDVFWVTVPDHADWLYKTGEQANVEVQFYKYGIPGDSIAINFEIGGEMMPADTKGTVIMRKGKATIPVGTMKKPGFRDCRLTTTVDGKKYSHHVKVGFSPEKLRPYTTMPADFQQFWENEKVELAKFPLTYTKEHVKKYSTDQIDCYLIKLQVNQRGQSIYGYLFYPKKEGKYPVVLCPPGAGIKTIKEPLRHKYYAEQGCIRFEIEIHGLNPEMSEEEFKEISAAFNGRENGYLSNGLDSRDNYYMKRDISGLCPQHRPTDLTTGMGRKECNRSRRQPGRSISTRHRRTGSAGNGLRSQSSGSKRYGRLQSRSCRRLPPFLPKYRRYGYSRKDQNNGLL